MVIDDLTEEILQREGLYGAMRVLNGSVPHRYTAVFVREGVQLRNVALFDKQVPNAPLWEPFPLRDSFCSNVIRAGAALTVHDAKDDTRAAIRSHRAVRIVEAYCGVPLIDAAGVMRGTLCHFDEHPVVAEVDVEFMLRIPPLLLPYLPEA